MSEFYVGLMSGTSLDGVDAVLVDLHQGLRVVGHRHQAFEPQLRKELLALNDPGEQELHRAALAANALSRSYAELTQQLLQNHPHAPVIALGAHGQTVRHRPGEFDTRGYSLQLLNGALLAELTGISVVCDFRSRDVAAGGQGAPLVPAFHQAVFGQTGRPTAVLNIGGISNLSLLGRSPGGFDCGPGNCLMDLWIHRHRGQYFDADGAWAAQGQVLPELLARLLALPYFQQKPPRSTGRDLFNAAWLDSLLTPAAPVDVMRTLLELTALSITQALGLTQATAGDLLVCGGGALNTTLMSRLLALLPHWQVMRTEASGLPVMQVEAAAFAWLAQRFMQHLPGNLPAVTGAQGLRIWERSTPHRKSRPLAAFSMRLTALSGGHFGGARHAATVTYTCAREDSEHRAPSTEQ